jgi:hypothetical protein
MAADPCDQAGSTTRRRLARLRPLPLLCQLPVAFVLAACTASGAGPSPSPGIEARLIATVVDVTSPQPFTSAPSVVTFVFNGHKVSAPTAPGIRVEPHLKGTTAIVYGRINRDGSFVILSIEPIAD